MNFKVWLLLISIPLACEVSIGFVGIIGLVLTNIVYFPISWLGDPFFTCNSEVGCFPKDTDQSKLLPLCQIQGHLIHVG